MTLLEAIDAVDREQERLAVEHSAYWESEITDTHEVIRNSEVFKGMLRAQLAHLDEYGTIPTIGCALALGIRMGIEVGKLLQKNQQIN